MSAESWTSSFFTSPRIPANLIALMHYVSDKLDGECADEC